MLKNVRRFSGVYIHRFAIRWHGHIRSARLKSCGIRAPGAHGRWLEKIREHEFAECHETLFHTRQHRCDEPQPLILLRCRYFDGGRIARQLASKGHGRLPEFAERRDPAAPVLPSHSRGRKPGYNCNKPKRRASVRAPPRLRGSRLRLRLYSMRFRQSLSTGRAKT